MAWRIIKYLSIATLILGVIAIAYSFYLKDVMAAEPGACETVSEDTVRLTGRIDDGMKACALRRLTPQVTTVIVDSPGGETFAGRTIGNRIGDVPRTLIVDGVCLSSCGNYFVPAATTVELTKGSIVGLHGTPDPYTLGQFDFEALIAKQVKQGILTQSEGDGSLVMQAERDALELAEEAAFAARFNVPQGWRLYRESGDKIDDWKRHFTRGSDTGIKPTDMLIVEGPMMASCLPGIKTNDWQTSLDETVFNNWLLWKTYRATGAYRSKGLTCLPK